MHILTSSLSHFHICCSLTTSLVIQFSYYIYISTSVTTAVHKTLPFCPQWLLRCIDAAPGRRRWLLMISKPIKRRKKLWCFPYRPWEQLQCLLFPWKHRDGRRIRCFLLRIKPLTIFHVDTLSRYVAQTFHCSSTTYALCILQHDCCFLHREGDTQTRLARDGYRGLVLDILII